MGRLILITNDDGIDAGGIRQLAERQQKHSASVGRRTGEPAQRQIAQRNVFRAALRARASGYMDGVKAYECSGVPGGLCARGHPSARSQA